MKKMLWAMVGLSLSNALYAMDPHELPTNDYRILITKHVNKQKHNQPSYLAHTAVRYKDAQLLTNDETKKLAQEEQDRQRAQNVTVPEILQTEFKLFKRFMALFNPDYSDQVLVLSVESTTSRDNQD